MKQLEVTILGQSYILACPDGGERALLEAVGTVDREMSAIRDAGKVKARERMAVLAALNLAYQLAETAPAAARPAPRAATAGDALPPDADLEALIRRIDGALGQDGLLL
jgi:cell division protein ZapA